METLIYLTLGIGIVALVISVISLMATLRNKKR